MPQLVGKMGVLLVPPTDVMGWPVRKELRQRQERYYGVDPIHDSDEMRSIVDEHTNWRVFAAMTSKNGLEMDEPLLEILEKKKYEMVGYDTRGMGVLEYAALTLQHFKPVEHGRYGKKFSYEIDSPGSTVLIRNPMEHHGKTNVVTVGRDDGYRFQWQWVEHIHNYGAGKWRFRPAVEIID